MLHFTSKYIYDTIHASEIDLELYMFLRRQVKFREFLPRPELVFLLAGFVLTIFAKLKLGLAAKLALPDLGHILVPDILFFITFFLSIQLLVYVKPSGWLARLALIIAFIVFVWSVFNALWLIESNTQLQPEILTVFFNNPGEIWPIVRPRLENKINLVIFVSVLSSLLLYFFTLNLIRPKLPIKNRSVYVKRISFAMPPLVILFALNAGFPGNKNSTVDRQVLEFSSHYYALISTFSTFGLNEEPVQLRTIPRIGERKITCPKSQKDLPNIVLLVLESVPYNVTSLSDPNLNTTPTLRRLAAEGVNFQLTRVPMPHTTKAHWAMLTSTTPVISLNYKEAVINDVPYESLASILARVGYRSAFFEMSKGGFECATGLASNLGFDWAWFRENLNDSSAYLGYLAGDDFRLIDPAFEWILSERRPFFVTITTTVTHDPYTVPNWFEKPADSLSDRYFQALRYTDRFLERICSELQKHFLDKNTIVCIIGDHGTSFRNKGDGRSYPFEDVIRVPWVIYWPGHLAPTQVLSSRTQLDVTPTLLNLAGFDVTEAEFEGTDALDRCYPSPPLFFASFSVNSPMGVIEGNKKYIYLPFADSVYEYDLAMDPTEKYPVKISLAESERIKKLITGWQKKSQIEFGVHRVKQKLLYSHWQTFTSGQSAWSYYVND
jgi:glucan phosphoethanolaminetransferase (alkaline phosphatase superfamily)